MVHVIGKAFGKFHGDYLLANIMAKSGVIKKHFAGIRSHPESWAAIKKVCAFFMKLCFINSVRIIKTFAIVLYGKDMTMIL